MSNGLFRLDGKTAVVTGASRGLGADIASLLAESGAHVYVLSRGAGELEDVATRIHQKGGKCTPLVCDLLNDDQLEQAFSDLPALDILINNAGTNIPSRLADVKTSDLDFVLSLNVRATYLATRAAVRKMLESNDMSDRSIINISSQMGHVGAPDRSVYCMTKHAMEGLTKAAAIELAPRIRVNSVAPTFADTPMTRPFFENEQFKRWVFDRIPMGRLLQSDQVAAAVLYLASPAAAMVTGTSLRIDGGWTAQ
jgi:NAD(P)-dependent dehydrogenase (short-subunit alcohol dehydrogenase family)